MNVVDDHSASHARSLLRLEDFIFMLLQERRVGITYERTYHPATSRVAVTPLQRAKGRMFLLDTLDRGNAPPFMRLRNKPNP